MNNELQTGMSQSVKIILICLGVIALVVIGVLIGRLTQSDSEVFTTATPIATVSSSPVSTANIGAETVKGVVLDSTKNYGNKYADGILPVGDNKYSTTEAKKGSIYLCRANFVPASQAGAQKRGPWFTNNNTEWDVNKKATIQGSVSWTPKMTNTIASGMRTISTNGLPDHKTGTYPVGQSDPARVYDANPNSIKEQALTYSLSASPVYGDPQCMGGEVGVMLTGVSIFNGFDAGGRDAGAWEVQDACDGHPQNKGQYHYHSLSRCITDIGVETVIGFALDGFPITGPKVGEANILTTDDLDECHGLTSEVTLDGKKVMTYHYVMTQDFPYSASCFRAKAANPPR